MSVFRSRRVLQHDYTPSRLPHRDHQMKELWRYFEPVLSEEATAKVHVYGPIGTGKTVLCKRFGIDFEEEAFKRKEKVRYVHVNLSYTPKIPYILTQLVDQVSFINTPRSGLGPEEMLRDVAKTLSQEDYRLILVLDEVDTYIREKGNPKIFYMLGRFHELYPDPTPRLSLIYISRSLGWMDKLDRATLETLGRVSGVNLDEYDPREITDILSYRAEEALTSAAFSEDIIQFIADLSVSNGGIRYALELLSEAGGIADREYANSVRPGHVRIAHVNIPKGVNGAYYPADLSLHKQLLLRAVIDALENNRTPYVPIEEIYGRYQEVCGGHRLEVKEEAVISSYLKDLKVEGYVLLKEEGSKAAIEFPLIRMRDSIEEALKHTLQLSNSI